MWQAQECGKYQEKLHFMQFLTEANGMHKQNFCEDRSIYQSKSSAYETL